MKARTRKRLLNARLKAYLKVERYLLSRARSHFPAYCALIDPAITFTSTMSRIKRGAL